MTTFQVSIPENKISFFKEFLENIGVYYTELASDFELSQEQKILLDKIDEIPLSEYTPVQQNKRYIIKAIFQTSQNPEKYPE